MSIFWDQFFNLQKFSQFSKRTRKILLSWQTERLSTRHLPAKFNGENFGTKLNLRGAHLKSDDIDKSSLLFSSRRQNCSGTPDLMLKISQLCSGFQYSFSQISGNDLPGAVSPI